MVSVSEEVPAPASAVYSVLADYREGHPAILPRRYFPSFAVEEGGSGAGTVIRFAFHLPGARRTVRALIAEPEPGRILTERDLDNGAVTRFVVEPTADEWVTWVTIETTWDRHGIAGWVERWLAPSFLERVYLEELSNLSVYCRLRFPASAVRQ